MSTQLPLQTLLELSQTRLDEAARQLGQLFSSEQEGAEKLGVLLRYRDEYQASFVAAARLGLGHNAWLNYESFLKRLELAIAEQRKLLDLSKQNSAAGQKTWLAERGRNKTYDTLAQRSQALREKAKNKIEQGESDERAAHYFTAAGHTEHTT